MNDEVELVLDARAAIGEGPVWDAPANELVWVDILAGLIHRTTPDGRDTTFDVGRPVGSVALRRSGGLVLATDDGFRILDPGASATRLVAAVEADDPLTRMNDGGCDPAGRFWAGTMARDEGPGLGTLYRLEADGTVAAVVRPVSISNGLDWAPDGITMYYIDSTAQGVDTFRWDASTGTLTDRRRLITFDRRADGAPDGLTLDADGHIWVALWDGWCIRRYTPGGRLEREVRLPVARVTSMAFGGPDLRDLYVTSAWRDLTDTERASQPHAGSLFRCRPGVTGRLPARYAG
jgi:sugar lactone lactonase YvrE